MKCVWLQYGLRLSSVITGLSLFVSVFALWLFEESWHFWSSHRQTEFNPVAPSFSVIWHYSVLLCKRKLFFPTVSKKKVCRILTNIVYTVAMVNLKTYLILILYLLLSVFVRGTDLNRNKFLRLCVYQMTIEVISNEFLILWIKEIPVLCASDMKFYLTTNKAKKY